MGGREVKNPCMKITSNNLILSEFVKLARIIFALLLSVAWVITARPAGAQEKSLLWTVSDGKNSVQLLGSIHYLKKENFPLNKTIVDALDRNKRLVLEIDLNSAKPEVAQKVMLSKAIYQDGTTLQQNISAEAFELASKRATQLGLDIKVLMPVKPWFVSITLVAFRLQQLGFDSNLGVDSFLAARAKSNGTPVSGLETLEYQIGVMDELSKADQELLLRQSVSDLDLLDENIHAIVQAWLKGDANALEPLLLGSMKDYPAIQEKLIVERNRRWVPQIEKMLGEGGGVLVTVGAAHLIGKDGVVEMLKARGYKVEQN